MVNQVYLAAFAGNIISFSAGCSLAWSSPILPKLNDTDVSSIPFGRKITDEEGSWIGSCLALGAIFGPFLFGYAADKFGRKLTIISMGIPLVVAYLLLAFAKLVPLYFLARFLIGVSVGGIFTVMPMYMGEIAEDTNRGALGSAMNVLLTAGLTFAYALGPYVSIVVFNVVLAVIPMIFMVLFFFTSPESPHYYVSKGKMEAAEKALKHLRGPNYEDELKDIKAAIESSTKGNVLDLCKSKGKVKAFVISLMLVALQQLAGINAVLFYAQTIFTASGSKLAPEIASIIIGLVEFITSFISPLAVDRLGRKVLLYFSAIGMALSEIPLGVYFFMKNHGEDVDAISWLPLVCLVFFIITYNSGFGPLPWAVMGEIFPNDVKSIASAFTAMFCWFIGFLITKFFQSIVDAIGMGPSFWVFAGFCIFGFFFLLFYVVETKGKSLQEIQDILES